MNTPAGNPVGKSVFSHLSLGRTGRLVICGLRFSPNLGKGVISECLTYLIGNVRPDLEIVHIDLAGRTAFTGTNGRKRSLVLKLLPKIPQPLRQRLVLFLLGGKIDALEPGWRALIRDKTSVVIGGGQIFADCDLNFPIKIGRIARICRDERVSVAVYGAGAGEGWSARGARLFAQLHAVKLQYVALRDERSVAAFTRQMPELDCGIRVVPDPAVLAETVYGPAPEHTLALGRGRVGLCITAAEVLQYHADMPVVGGRHTRVFFLNVIVHLCGQGLSVALFTNGALEDEASLTSLIADPALADIVADGRLIRHAAFLSPRDLAHAISSHDVIVAHRLHASIIAFAYGVPSLGLGWDRKVESFYSLTGREVHCVVDASMTPEYLCHRIIAAKCHPIPDEVRNCLMTQTVQGIADLLT